MRSLFRGFIGVAAIAFAVMGSPSDAAASKEAVESAGCWYCNPSSQCIHNGMLGMSLCSTPCAGMVWDCAIT